MRIFIPALVLALAAVWPQTACAEHEHDTTEQPPVITMKWTGLVPAINLVRDPGDALHSASEQFLVIVVVTGANIEWENYLVTLSADHEAKAEAETRGGVALFTLPVDFPIQQTLAVQVRRTHYSPLPSELVIQYEPDLIPNALAEAEEESSLIFRPH